jgi:tRNA A37 N6-isopentenylltransferase MiaA
MRKVGWLPRQVNLTLVVGPTGVGKTDRGLELARDADAPVVVLDRVQCHRELAIGSGRHHGDESGHRIFLADRGVANGVIPASQAYERLLGILDRQRALGHANVVLEGGSVSLLAVMAIDTRWRRDATVSVELIAPDDDYPERVFRRVERMLSGSRTMLDEVRALLPDPRTHPVLADITGYREILDVLREGRPVDLARLAGDITRAHLAYSREQMKRLPEVLGRILTSRTTADAVTNQS